MNQNNNFMNNFGNGFMNNASNGTHQIGGAPQILRNRDGLGGSEFNNQMYQQKILNQSSQFQTQANRVQFNAQQLKLNALQAAQQQRPMIRLAPSEVCSKHSETNVAYNEKTKEIFCNTCIFEKKISELKFTAIVVKELKERFAKEYVKYKESLNHVNQTNPEIVKQSVRNMVADFFTQIKFKVKDLQKDVMENIKNSENLKNLEKTLEQSKEFIQADPTQPDQFEREKKIFDEKVSKGRYAYVVKRREFFNNLIENLEKSRLKMNQTIDKSMEYQQRILKVNNDDRFMQEKLGEIMKDCINIDSQFPVQQSQFGVINKPAFSLGQSAFQQQNQVNQQVQQQQQNFTSQANMALRQQQQANLFSGQQQQVQTPTQVQAQAISPQKIQQVSSPQIQASSIQQINTLSNQQQSIPVQQRVIQQQQAVNQMQQQNMNVQQQQHALPFQQRVIQPQQPIQQQQQQWRAAAQPQPNFVQQLAQAQNLQNQVQAQQNAAHQQAQQAVVQQQQPIVQQASSPQQQISQTQAAIPLQQVQLQLQQAANQHRDSDDIVITGQSYNLPKDFNYKTFFKLKSMNVLKLLPGQGWQRFTDHSQLFMAKCVHTQDEVVYTIGGARDQKTKQTIHDVIASQLINGQVVQQQKSKMITSRASFGCTYSAGRNEIYVAGGYTEGELNKKAEKYSIAEDKWTALADLNENKCSQSLIVLGDRYLYSIGGLSKVENNVQLNTTIERIDLLNPKAEWTILSIKLNEAACDIGCLAISKDEILIFGGWNKNPLSNAYIIKKCDNMIAQGLPSKMDTVKHEMKQIEAGLERPDFFLCTGIAMKTENPSQVKVCGHTALFTYDLKLRKFVASSSV